MQAYRFTIESIPEVSDYRQGDSVEVAASTPMFAAFLAGYEVGLGACRVRYCKNQKAIIYNGKGEAVLSFKAVN